MHFSGRHASFELLIGGLYSLMRDTQVPTRLLPKPVVFYAAAAFLLMMSFITYAHR